MEERAVNLLRLCIQAKDCGIDAFFGWQPHVNCLTVDVYEDGWNELVKPERDLMISLKDEDAGELRSGICFECSLELKSKRKSGKKLFGWHKATIDKLEWSIF